MLNSTGTSVNVTNSGGIFAFGKYSVGVDLGVGGGTIVNNAGADIYAAGNGVYLSSGTVTNAGNIVGEGLFGVIGGVSVDIANNASGFIHGAYYGVQLNPLATLTNAGSIFGGRVGVFASDATVINAGTITGDTAAVVFGGGLRCGREGPGRFGRIVAGRLYRSRSRRSGRSFLRSYRPPAQHRIGKRLAVALHRAAGEDADEYGALAAALVDERAPRGHPPPTPRTRPIPSP